MKTQQQQFKTKSQGSKPKNLIVKDKGILHFKSTFLRRDNHFAIELRFDCHLSNAAFPTHCDIENLQ